MLPISRKSIKKIHDLEYYTGSHPPILAHYRSGKRPTEFGNKVWATSLVLIDHIKQSSLNLEGLRVLEVACGWGLLGAFLAKSYHCKVCCTDIDPHVLPIVQMQAELNDISLETKQAALSDISLEDLQHIDLIIGAELCYSDEITKEVIELIDRAFSAQVKHILIADPGRPDFGDCLKHCEDKYETEVSELAGSVNGKITYLLSIKNQPVTASNS